MKKEQLADSFRNSSNGTEERKGLRGFAALLAGATLLFTFATDVQKAAAHGTSAPPTLEEQTALDRYKDFESLLKKEADSESIGLQVIAREGLLGYLAPNSLQGLIDNPQNLGLLDAGGVTVLEKHIDSRRAAYGSADLKRAIYEYTDSLSAEEQLKYFRLAVENDVYKVFHEIPERRIFPLVSIDKLEGHHLLATQIRSVSEDKRILANPVVDAVQKFHYDAGFQKKLEILTPEEKKELAKLKNGVGDTIGHMIIKSYPAEYLDFWRNHIDWEVENNLKQTPLQLVSEQKGKFTALFGKERPDVIIGLLSAEKSQGAVAALFHTHEILGLGREVVRAIVTPENLARSAPTLEPHCLAQFFTPEVMAGWHVEDVKTLWGRINPSYKHQREVQDAFVSVLAALRPTAGQSEMSVRPRLALK